MTTYDPGMSSPFLPKTEPEYQAKLDELASAITRMDPHVLAVQEVGDPVALGGLADRVGGNLAHRDRSAGDRHCPHHPGRSPVAAATNHLGPGGGVSRQAAERSSKATSQPTTRTVMGLGVSETLMEAQLPVE